MAQNSKSSLGSRARIFAALGEPRRLLIAESLSLSHRTPGELMEISGLSSNLLTHHLDILEKAGLVRRLAGSSDRRKRFVALENSAHEFLRPANLLGNVLFVCTQNSARSQLASAMWSAETGRPALSAGTQPADRVHPMAIEVARSHGLDLSNATPQLLSPKLVGKNTIITVCDQAHDELSDPLTRMHWSIPDPAKRGRLSDFENSFNSIQQLINIMKGKRNVI